MKPVFGAYKAGVEVELYDMTMMAYPNSPTVCWHFDEFVVLTEEEYASRAAEYDQKLLKKP